MSYNPLTPAAVSKPLEMIGRPTYVLACSEPTAPDSDINQTAGSRGRLSMWKNRCMHAAVLRAGQSKWDGDAAKSGEFLGEFSWVEFDPMGVRGLKTYWALLRLLTNKAFTDSLTWSERGVLLDTETMIWHSKLNSKSSAVWHSIMKGLVIIE